MESRFVERDAEAMVERCAHARRRGRSRVARLYDATCSDATRGSSLHGGGNTSVKTALPDLLGETVEVLCIKGTGGDMAAIEPAGLPAVRRLEPTA